MFHHLKIGKNAWIALILMFFGMFYLNMGNVATPQWIKENKFDSKMYSYMYGLMMISSMISIPFWNSISNHHGPKWVMIGCIIFYAAMQAILPVTAKGGSLPGLIIPRILVGFAGGPVVLYGLRAFLSSTSGVHNRAVILNIGMGVTTLSGGLSYFVMGFVLNVTTTNWIFWIQAIFGGVFALLILFLVKNRAILRVENYHPVKDTLSAFSYMKGKGVYPLLVPYLLLMIVLQSAMRIFNQVIHIESGFNLDSRWIGYFQFYVSILSLITTVFLMPLMKKRLSDRFSTFLFAIIGFGIILGLPFIKVHSMQSKYVIMGLFGLYQAFALTYQSIFMAHITSKVHHRPRTVMSIMQSLAFGAQAIGLFSLSAFGWNTIMFITFGFGIASLLILQIYIDVFENGKRPITRKQIKAKTSV